MHSGEISFSNTPYSSVNMAIVFVRAQVQSDDEIKQIDIYEADKLIASIYG